MEQNSNNRRALKAGAWYTASTFLTRAIVFLTTPIFARLLSTADFGGFHVYASWQSILLIVCSMEFSLTLNRAKFDFSEEEKKAYVSTNLLVSLFLSLCLFLAAASSRWVRVSLLKLDTNYLIYMFLYLGFYPAFEVFQCEQRIQYKYKLSTALSFGSILAGFSLSLLFAVLFSDRLFGRIVGQYLPPIVLGLFFLIYYFRRSFRLDFKYCRYALTISVPLVFSYLASQVLTSSDKIVLQHFSSADAVAFIGLTTTCSHIMTILIQTLNNAWIPWMYDKYHVKAFDEINRVLRVYQLFILMGALFVILIGPEIILILGGSKYDGALILIPPVITGSIYTFLQFQYMNVETYYKKTFFSGLSTALIAAANVVLDIIFVKKYGFWAASYVTVFCYAILMLAHYLYVKLVLKDQLFRFSSCLITLGATLLFLWPVKYLYGMRLLRYACAAACALCAMLTALRLIKKHHLLSGMLSKKERA